MSGTASAPITYSGDAVHVLPADFNELVAYVLAILVSGTANEITVVNAGSQSFIISLPDDVIIENSLVVDGKDMTKWAVLQG